MKTHYSLWDLSIAAGAMKAEAMKAEAMKAGA